MNKKKVIENFSKASKTYDNATEIQRKVADRVLEIILKIYGQNYIERVLELGAGTGYLTIPFIDKIKVGKFIVSDISDGMLGILRSKLLDIDFSNLEFMLLDCDNISYYKSLPFNLIVSSSSIQWVDDIELFLSNVYEKLVLGGKFIFSMFGEHTFYELDDIVSSIKNGYFIRKKIISFDKMKKNINKCGFFIDYSQNEFFVENFLSVKDFARNQKKIGAVNTNKNELVLSKNDWKAIEKNYRQKYSTVNNDLKFTNDIYYFVISKKK